MVAMGIGELGEPSKIIKRKFRFTIEIEAPSGKVPQHFVRLGSRPQLDIEEQEINFLNGVTWIPGKGRWQPLSVTYHDVADSQMAPLYNWVASIYDFMKAPNDLPQTEKSGWAATVIIKMYDGCGTEMERWELKSAWVTSINFGDLDYGDSDTATIELTIRYSEAKLTGSCGTPTPSGSCRGC